MCDPIQALTSVAATGFTGPKYRQRPCNRTPAIGRARGDAATSRREAATIQRCAQCASASAM
jgi:hypothetical protein